MKRLVLIFVSFATAINFLMCDVSAQLQFNYESTGSLRADSALDEALSVWSDVFEDQITINLDFEFTVLPHNVFAGATVRLQQYSYGSFWNAIGNDMSSQTDASLFNALPTGSSFSLYINRTSESAGADYSVPYVDDDGGANNTIVNLTSANAKALGLRDPDDAVLDATIAFNLAHLWDYNRDDGIQGSALDFVGIATHEIGHALGFVSGVDALDSISAQGSNEPQRAPDDTYVDVTSLDFLRHSQESLLAGADLDWTADNRDKYFSTDGTGAGSDWSTSVNFGDGEQASHWKKGKNLGIMDPNAEAGGIYELSDLDLRAFDAIGYNLAPGSTTSVPEPGAMGLLAILSLVPVLRRRRG